MKTGALSIVGTVQKSFQKIYETTLISATTSITISSLDGDTDVEYRLLTRIINNYSSWVGFWLRLNNDSGTNYGRQYLLGQDATATAGSITTETGFLLGAMGTVGHNGFSDTLIYAKSGYIRTAITDMSDRNTGTTVGRLMLMGQSWNNTSTNITSLVIAADQTDGLGIGTRIELYRRRL